jgi:hypothetical protein
MLATIVGVVLVLAMVIAVAFRREVSGLGRMYRARRFDAVYERNRRRAGRR